MRAFLLLGLLTPFLLTLLGLADANAADERKMHIVELRYSLAAPVLEVLRPHLPAGAGASAVDNKLLLNVTDSEWESVQNVIGVLDKPPMRLLVSVRWLQQSESVSDNTSGSVTIDDNEVSVRAGGTVQTTRDNQQQMQQVNTLGGQTAFIHTGMDIPDLTIHITPRGYLVGSQNYRESGRGFYVLPVVQPDGQVLVRINPRERVPVTDEHGAMHISVLETQVNGELGKWLPLGGVQQAGDSTWQTQRGLWKVELKVDKLP